MGSPQLKDQGKPVDNVLTEFTKSIAEFLGGPGGLAQDQLNFGTDLQRQVGGSIGRDLGATGADTRFGVEGQIDALRESQAIDRRRGLGEIQEQFGAGGLRFGTPIAVGSGRFLEGIIPKQEAQIQDLRFRAFESAEERALRTRLGAQSTGASLGTGSVDSILNFARGGREDTAQKQGLTSGFKDVASAFKPIGSD